MQAGLLEFDRQAVFCADTIAQKIKKAKTDPEPLPEKLEDMANRPEALNLVTIYAALSGESREEVLKKFATKQFSVFKPALVDVAVEKLAPITSRMKVLMDDPSQIDKILKKGNEKANDEAAPVIAEAMKIMGFYG